ncbi:MAG: hypothetical protein Q4G69_08500 [Planctomycetia bacterium]|nr:hypothetical protein [Planctomycetia bacterium]
MPDPNISPPPSESAESKRHIFRTDRFSEDPANQKNGEQPSPSEGSFPPKTANPRFRNSTRPASPFQPAGKTPDGSAPAHKSYGPNIPNTSNIPNGPSIPNTSHPLPGSSGRPLPPPGSSKNSPQQMPGKNPPGMESGIPISKDNPALSLIFRQTTFQERLKVARTWLFSVFFHILLIFPFIFLVVNESTRNFIEVISQPGENENLSLDIQEHQDGMESHAEMAMENVAPDLSKEMKADNFTVLKDPDTVPVEDGRLMFDSLPTADLAGTHQTAGGGLFESRGTNKQTMIATGGGSEGSEKAVASALQWIANHQLPNGSWTFNINECTKCKGQCRNSGAIQNSPYGATAMALLPFISAGNTPYKGKYKSNVQRGLKFLLDKGKRTEAGLCFSDYGTMYSHGMAAIAFCETYGMMTQEERSRWSAIGSAAISTVNYISRAQDKVGGGWRYYPQQAGDTSVLGWQLMALKSTQLSKISLLGRGTVFGKALSFLKDVVGYNNGSQYGYTHNSGGTFATTSVGLLCRLYLDWKPDNTDLLHGADLLLAEGPNFGDPYYVYYATQLFHHIGGSRWTEWNNIVRDTLIKTQETEGHERGSWYPQDANSHCTRGGRLYVTALNCMTLEVYYRYMPLYQTTGSENEFPID